MEMRRANARFRNFAGWGWKTAWKIICTFRGWDESSDLCCRTLVLVRDALLEIVSRYGHDGRNVRPPDPTLVFYPYRCNNLRPAG